MANTARDPKQFWILLALAFKRAVYMYAYERVRHNFGVYTHRAKGFKLWRKMPLTSEYLSYALSMITSESGLCLAWKPDIQTHFCVCFCRM